MTTYFAGSEPEIFDTFTGSVSTNSNIAISGENRSGIVFDGSLQTANASWSTGVTEGYVHFKIFRNETAGLNQSGTVFAFRNEENVNLFFVTCNLFNLDFVFNAPNGNTFTGSAATTNTVDVYYNLHPSSGQFRLWFNGILQTDYIGSVQFSSGTQSGRKIFLSGFPNSSSGRDLHFSQFLVSDKNTVFSKVYTLPLSLDTTDWTGNVSNVITASTATLVNSISSNIATSNVFFNVTDLPTLSNTQSIDSIVLSSSALFEIGSVSNTLTSLIKTTSNTVIEGNTNNLTTTFGTQQFIFNTNPENSLAWSESAVDDVKLGFTIKES